MANTATVIVLVAGGATFTNEWYQTHNINWRVPLATVLLGAAVDGLATINEHAATSLAVMVLIGALVTKFNGKSVADQLVASFPTNTKKR